MSHNVKYGLFLGFISIALTLAIVLIDPTLMVATWFQILSLLVNIAILVIAGIELRKQQGGYLSFKKAFISTLIIIAIGSALSTVYTILHFNVIDPGIKETISESVVNRTVGMLENFGADDEVIDEAVANLEAQDTFGTQTLLLGYLYSLIGGAIIALIIAAIVKKKEPEFD